MAMKKLRELWRRLKKPKPKITRSHEPGYPETSYWWCEGENLLHGGGNTPVQAWNSYRDMRDFFASDYNDQATFERDRHNGLV